VRWGASLAIALCTGCMMPTPIGPYVKSVARNGAYLAVQKCTIVLDGDNLREAQCGWEQVPIAALPPPPPR
jgi:hypothetical protein